MINRIVLVALGLMLSAQGVASSSKADCFLSSYLSLKEADYVKLLQDGDAGTTYRLAMEELRQADYELTTTTWNLLLDGARVSSVNNPDFDTRLYSAMLALSGKLSATSNNGDFITSSALKAKVMLCMAWQVSCRVNVKAPSHEHDIVKVNTLMLYGNYLAILLQLPDSREYAGYTEEKLRDKISQVKIALSEISRSD